MSAEYDHSEWRSERLARLALYLALNNSPALFHRVLRALGSAAEAFEGHDLRGLGVNLLPLMRAGRLDEAQALLESSGKSGLDIIVFGDDDYPLRLSEVADPPPVLWVRGALRPGDRYAVAMVGAREATEAGLLAARGMAREGALSGLTIVSGLARGIDAACHRGALEAGGRTIAVLGCGPDYVYPRENARMFEEIPEQGAILSEFPPGTKPLPVYFPRRNRVIAALALAVVVVEAGERSGALITARLALEMNRDVMALPGPAGSKYSRGANQLIKNGAALVESMAEVLAEIRPRLLEGLVRPESGDGAPPSAGLSSETAEKAPPVKTPGRRSSSRAAALAENAEKAAPVAPVAGSPEEAILAHLSSGRLDADALIRLTGLAAPEMAGALLNLELMGLAARLASGFYEKI
ncbi:MAG: DNA-processing protein DprA [Candidatus Adiutrix sp.]|jgi:DNA processing protein|nr:DNA-processing protein DprA [Candidatus Adiutrix sp.]